MWSVAADLVADREHVLLGFDSAVCRVFAPKTAGAVADRLRCFLGSRIPAKLAATHDPLTVLRSAWLVSATVGHVIELELRQLELSAVPTAIETPGTLDVVKTLALRGHTVTLVSDWSADTVDAYLARHEIGRYVHEVSARHSLEPTPLMPDPFLVTQAMHLLHTTPNRCCLVGDSTRLIDAAHAAGVPIVAFAANARKRDRFAGHRPNAIINRMADLA